VKNFNEDWGIYAKGPRIKKEEKEYLFKEKRRKWG